jgi:molecular chaperone HtpG
MAKRTMEFKTELKELLNLIVNSLYSHKDIFLRELISNSSDAIDKVRFDSLTNNKLLEGDSEWKIKIIADKKHSTLTVQDNGIGMSREEISEQLGTIAKSGTKAFVQSLKNMDAKDHPELIGQFGVGFYSSFMVADKVTVVSRKAGDKNKGVKWISDGKGSFSVEACEKEKHGTDVILDLKDDCKNFTEDWELREIIRKYSDYVEHPIVMDVESEEEKEDSKGKKKKKKVTKEETLNSRKAIWLKKKSEVDKKEYDEFYKHISRDFEEPAHVIHYSAEGTLEFKALLYIPSKRPFDLFYPEMRSGLHLYVRRVFIMDDCKKVIPEYLRFIRGVVDSSDLPLNVSRELLQQDSQLEKIRKNLVNKVFNTLKELKEKKYNQYLDFYKQFGMVLKEGLHTDWENREKLQDFLLYESTKTKPGKYVSLKDYLNAMPKEQKEIYYIAGENRAELEKSPYLEVFRKKDYEVLFMTDPIDEWVMSNLFEYQKKRFKAVNKGDIEVDGDEVKKQKKDKEKRFKDLLELIREKLDNVKEVRLSSRLTESACCLVADEHDMGAHMERLMKNMNQEVPSSKRILELNPNHALVEAMHKLFEKDSKSPRLVEYSELLYDQALLAEGSKIKDPLLFAKRINQFMARECESLVKK